MILEHISSEEGDADVPDLEATVRELTILVERWEDWGREQLECLHAEFSRFDGPQGLVDAVKRLKPTPGSQEIS